MIEKSKDLKSIILSAVFSGFVYAVIMSFIDHFFMDQPSGFNLFKFFIYFVLFGSLMFAISWWKHKRKRNQ